MLATARVFVSTLRLDIYKFRTSFSSGSIAETYFTQTRHLSRLMVEAKLEDLLLWALIPLRNSRWWPHLLLTWVELLLRIIVPTISQIPTHKIAELDSTVQEIWLPPKAWARQRSLPIWSVSERKLLLETIWPMRISSKTIFSRWEGILWKRNRLEIFRSNKTRTSLVKLAVETLKRLRLSWEALRFSKMNSYSSTTKNSSTTNLRKWRIVRRLRKASSTSSHSFLESCWINIVKVFKDRCERTSRTISWRKARVSLEIQVTVSIQANVTEEPRVWPLELHQWDPLSKDRSICVKIASSGTPEWWQVLSSPSTTVAMLLQVLTIVYFKITTPRSSKLGVRHSNAMRIRLPPRKISMSTWWASILREFKKTKVKSWQSSK